MARFHTVLVIFLFALLSACGGGGGSSSSETATVSVVLTDAPVLGYDKALATINSIELLGDEGGPVTLFTGSVTVDLLKLRDYQEVFSITDNVPPGTYSKIRLHLESLELIKVDDEGEEIVPGEFVELVANGKIDLNPQGPFRILAGSNVFITLDFDMEKSVHLHVTGNGKIKLRPVIFVNISDRQPIPKLARIRGVVGDISEDGQQFRLCRAERVAQVSIATLDSSLRGCILIVTGERTGLFGEDGLPIDFVDLEPGNLVTVVGRLTIVPDDGEPEIPPLSVVASSDDDDWDSDHDWDDHTCQPVIPLDDSDDDDEGEDCEQVKFGFAAMVVERGAPGTFRVWRGETVTGVDPLSQQFDFAFAPAQGYAPGAEITTQLYPKSWILSRNGMVLEPADIEPGQLAAVDGVISLDPNELRAALMIVGADEAANGRLLQGTVESVDPLANTLVVLSNTGEHRNVDAAGALVILWQGAESKVAELGDLEEGQTVSVFGEEGEDDVYIAGVIIARASDSPD